MNVQAHIVEGPVPCPCVTPTDHHTGAVFAFLGVVRRLEDDTPLDGIRYETYDPMALRELERLVTEAAERFSLRALHLTHSRGFVPVGEASLSLQAFATHRREALQGVDWVIDRLKQDVPIWKHPVFKPEHEHEGKDV